MTGRRHATTFPTPARTGGEDRPAPSPDDPRHGTRAGYIAGCREDCCRVPHVRYQKRSRLRHLREGKQYLDPALISRRLDRWARHGVTPHAVAIAAGLCSGTLTEQQRDGNRPEKATVKAVLAVTWDNLPDSALVNAELTRWRIYSLMAAGHSITWISEGIDGLSVGGKWRTQPRVTLGLARAVQHLYQTAPTWGPSRQTATKARNRGHQTPAAWDDPGTPAMPHGWKPELDTGSNHRHNTDVDHAVVERVLGGENLPTTRAEKDEIVRRWRSLGRSLNDLERRTGWKTDRYGREDSAA